MLQVTCKSQELEYVKTIIDKVISAYSEHLISKKYFEFLISDLKIEIRKAKKSIGGECITKKEPKILLKISEESSDKMIALVIAHELAHLLMTTKYMDSLAIAGEARDGSFNATAIQRVLANGEMYGNALEECVANYLAYYIVSNMNFPREKDYEEHVEQNAYFIHVIATLEYVFGKPLIECQYIDDIFDEGGEAVSFNMFWHSILSLSFGNVVNIFNDEMKKRGGVSFKRFCNLLEIYKISQDKKYRKELDEILDKFLAVAV